MKRKLLKLILILFLFELLYLPIFGTIQGKGLIYVVSFVNVFVFVFSILIVGRMQVISEYLFLLLLAIYTGICVLFNESNDTYYVVLFLGHFMAAYSIYYIVRFTKLDVKELLESLRFILLLNVFITVIEYLNLFGLAEFLFGLNKLFIRGHAYSVRAVGLFGGFDVNGLIVSFTFVLILILYLNEKKRFKKNIMIIYLLLSFMATFMTSRTGVISLFIWLILFMYLGRKKPVELNYKPRVEATKIAAFIILSFGIMWILYPNSFMRSYNFIFEALINLQTSGRLYTQSTNELFSTMYFIPTNVQTLLIGDSINNADRVTNFSDVGYVQLIQGIGLIGMSIVVAIYLFWISRLSKAKRKISSEINKWKIREILIILILIILIASFKGPYLFTFPILYIYYYLYAIILVKNLETQKKI